MVGLSRAKVYQLILEEEVPILHVGRSVRVPLDGPREWVKSLRQEAVSLAA